MSKQQKLETLLLREFQPDFVAVENESYLHSSERGAESHFKIVLVSDHFEGVTKVGRHRQIYQLLAQDLQQGIHALALHLYTKAEWIKLGQQIPRSTNCFGIGH